jgi:hypothetical protein
MAFSVKEQLSRLHHKQDAQTDKLGAIEVSVAKQQVMLEAHNVQFDRVVSEMAAMNKNVAEYNKELAVHIAGVMELKEQNRLMRTEIAQRDEIMGKRLDIAEKPIIWFKSTAKYLLWIGGAASGILAVIKLLKII